MMGNNNQQWYLHTFGTSQQKKVNKFSQYLQQNLRPGEEYALWYKNGLYRFQVHTTFAQLGLDVKNIITEKSSPYSQTFNQTKTLHGVKVFEKSLQNQININPMMMQKQNMMNMINNQNMMMNNKNMMNMNMINKKAMNMNQMMMMNNQNIINNNAMNINPMMMKGNNFISPNNIFQGFNNQFGNPQLNNNSINQQKQALEALDPNNCATQHIEQFFDRETILKKIKDRQTIYPVSNNVKQTYLNWFSDYIYRMYTLINGSALDKDTKKQCWQEKYSKKNEKIKFNINDNTLQSKLMTLTKTNFLNGRNSLLDGKDLIEDVNKTMKLLAECSLNVYKGRLKQTEIDRTMTVYEQLLECLAANPKAFVDRSILGFGSNRDNAFRKVVNDNVKVANLKDLIVGVIRLLPV
ncbi:MAG: hypothetical protein IJ590_03875 [Rickettsiales bacterium]|nr:hypothetical protein [Rickettsiales bacterium]